MPRNNFNHFRGHAEAFWWCIVTLTTTGYGDVVPRSPGGRIIAAATSECAPLDICVEKGCHGANWPEARLPSFPTVISGLFVISMPMAVVGSTFAEVREKRGLLRFLLASSKKR